jgi:subtilisin family serine protease
MRDLKWRENLVRRAALEICEPRAMMSAQPVAITANDNVASVVPLGSSAPASSSVYSFTGLVQMKSDYGLDGRGQTVAVIDSGIAWDHPALGKGFGTGYRVVGGWDFAGNDANPYDDGPGGSHGTHVSGIIGSTDATSPGVATGVDLVALRVFDSQGRGSITEIEQALEWVHTHRNDYRNPITTVNLSIGMDVTTLPTADWNRLQQDLKTLDDDGLFISVAAGNGFASRQTTGLSYPAASQYVVPVAAVDATGNLASFSQRDARVLAAPGVNIRSTVPDYMGNLNHRTDDFATFSGTSMAAPYIAGVSVLVREAMQLTGRTSINENTIYEVLRSTADSVVDSVTHASYFRVNVGRAIASLIPADDFGSTPQTAATLGTSNSISGMVNRLGDADYFRYTPTQSGTVTFTFTSQDNLVANWLGGSAGARISGNTMSFEVVAGQAYSLGVSAPQIGRYQMRWTNTVAPTNLGIVDFRQLNSQSLSGDTWYSFRPAQTGSVILDANAPLGTVGLEVYSAGKQLLIASGSDANRVSLTLKASAGDQLLVHVKGNAASFNLRLTNIMAASMLSKLAPQGIDHVLQMYGTS